MSKPKDHSRSISNRRARHDYTIKETYLAGVQLTGAETKALRLNHGQLQGAYVTIKDNELWLLNARISGSNDAPISETDQIRSRKLLANRKEIDQLVKAKQLGMTVVPLEILTGGRYIKVRIATAIGKRAYDKRSTLKARDQKRQINRYIKGS